MWNLWTSSQDLKKPPSELLEVAKWSLDRFGYVDWYAGFALDRAVTWFGRHIENKLAEHDKQGKPLHSLEDLLKDTPPMSVAEQINKELGIPIIRIDNRKKPD